MEKELQEIPKKTIQTSTSLWKIASSTTTLLKSWYVRLAALFTLVVAIDGAVSAMKSGFSLAQWFFDRRDNVIWFFNSAWLGPTLIVTVAFFMWQGLKQIIEQERISHEKSAQLLFDQNTLLTEGAKKVSDRVTENFDVYSHKFNITLDLFRRYMMANEKLKFLASLKTKLDTIEKNIFLTLKRFDDKDLDDLNVKYVETDLRESLYKWENILQTEYYIPNAEITKMRYSNLFPEDVDMANPPDADKIVDVSCKYLFKKWNVSKGFFAKFYELERQNALNILEQSRATIAPLEAS